MLPRHRHRLLGLTIQKTLPQDCLSRRRLSQVPLLHPPVRNPLILPSLQSGHGRSPDPPRTAHHIIPTQLQSFQRPTLLSHRPSRQAEPWPIPSMLLPALHRHRLRQVQVAQNQKSTSVRRAFLLLLPTRPRPNLADPSPAPLKSHARCPRHAVPRTAARTRSGASRHSPRVPSAASSRARRRQRGVLGPKGRTTGVRSPRLRPTADSRAVQRSRWMPWRGSRRHWVRHSPRERSPQRIRRRRLKDSYYALASLLSQPLNSFFYEAPNIPNQPWFISWGFLWFVSDTLLFLVPFDSLLLEYLCTLSSSRPKPRVKWSLPTIWIVISQLQ